MQVVDAAAVAATFAMLTRCVDASGHTNEFLGNLRKATSTLSRIRGFFS